MYTFISNTYYANGKYWDNFYNYPKRCFTLPNSEKGINRINRYIPKYIRKDVKEKKIINQRFSAKIKYGQIKL